LAAARRIAPFILLFAVFIVVEGMIADQSATSFSPPGDR